MAHSQRTVAPVTDQRDAALVAEQ